MYQGTYHSRTHHELDLDVVLRRAHDGGVRKVVGLAGTFDESERLQDLIGDLDGAAGVDGDRGASRGVLVFGTVGVHPTRCAEAFAGGGDGATPPATDGANGDDGDESSTLARSWIPKTEHQKREVIRRLIELANRGKESGRVVAIGDCGLDYARLQFCPAHIQRIGLLAQLKVARATGLPLYLHNRESGDDLHEILSGYGDGLRGVVYSFDETIEVANKFTSLGLYIGINGCSLKTPGNIETVRRLPLDRVILETDCPWCDVRPTHAGWAHVRTTYPTINEKKYTRELGRGGYCVKNRTEPCHVAQVAEVIAGVRGIDVDEVVRVCGKNVHDLFGSMERRRI